MHVFGNKGYLFIDDAENMRYRFAEKSKEKSLRVQPNKVPFDDPFTFFTSVIKGQAIFKSVDLSSPEVNLTVVEILDAARKSARTGKKVNLKSKTNKK